MYDWLGPECIYSTQYSSVVCRVEEAEHGLRYIKENSVFGTWSVIFNPWLASYKTHCSFAAVRLCTYIYFYTISVFLQSIA